MTLERVTGLLLIVMPVAFNVFFFLLGRRFDYPNILRQPTGEILRRFQAGGTALKLTWHGFFLTAVAFVPLVILVSQSWRRRTWPWCRWPPHSGCWRPRCSSSV